MIYVTHFCSFAVAQFLKLAGDRPPPEIQGFSCRMSLSPVAEQCDMICDDRCRLMTLPFGPRFRLRRNHACGAFPPFGFNR